MAIKLVKDKNEDEKRIQPFSYDLITDRDKTVVEEVLRELQIEDSIKLEKLKEKFQIIPTTEVPYDKGIFYNLCKELELYCTPQGFIKEGSVKYPILSLTADCRQLEQLVMHIVKKYEKSNT